MACFDLGSAKCSRLSFGTRTTVQRWLSLIERKKPDVVVQIASLTQMSQERWKLWCSRMCRFPGSSFQLGTSFPESILKVGASWSSSRCRIPIPTTSSAVQGLGLFGRSGNVRFCRPRTSTRRPWELPKRAPSSATASTRWLGASF